MDKDVPALRGFQQQDVDNLTGQLAPRSQRIYKNDASVFATWIAENSLTPQLLTRSDVIAYRSYLATTYSKATAQRMFSVARRLLGEQVYSKARADNPADNVKGFTGNNETPHTALRTQEAKKLLAAIDTSTKAGKRDMALISLLLRTGIRRSECVALNIGDIKEEQGHHIAMVQHGKGDKRRTVKLPVDVFRTIEIYVQACDRNTGMDTPLFVRMYKGDTPSHNRMSDKAVEDMVIKYGNAIGVDLTPHGLRATFVTLALEGGAMLQQVQYAAGHADPRTTERYQKRKMNLDDNAVDYIHL